MKIQTMKENVHYYSIGMLNNLDSNISERILELKSEDKKDYNLLNELFNVRDMITQLKKNELEEIKKNKPF